MSSPLSVIELNELIKINLSGSFDKISVKGEITNIKKSNGNLYFTLKDDMAFISCIYWRCKDDVKNGDLVVIDGKITCFTKQGTYQITVNTITNSGVGDINIKYQQMKDDFEKKSYFTKKRPFPQKINNIGILTSLEGAALQDILYVLNNNNFTGNVYVKNCFVQGVNCPKSVKEGIEYFNKLNNVDILVIARGGGSVEDLIGYSSEEIVKAIYTSQLFTISAIGHEVDTMLSDFAADYRAPTPSIAGETIIKYQKKESDDILKYHEKIKEISYSIKSKINNYELFIGQLENRYKNLDPVNLINQEIEILSQIQRKIKDKINHNLYEATHEIDKMKIKNNMFNTHNIMNQGYVIITDHDNNLISSVNDFKDKITKIPLKIIFPDGEYFI